MGKKSKSKQNKVKKVTKPVVNKIDSDEVSLDDVETSVIEEVVEVQHVEETTTDELKSVESEWTVEYNSLLALREDEKKNSIRKGRISKGIHEGAWKEDEGV